MASHLDARNQFLIGHRAKLVKLRLRPLRLLEPLRARVDVPGAVREQRVQPLVRRRAPPPPLIDFELASSVLLRACGAALLIPLLLLLAPLPLLLGLPSTLLLLASKLVAAHVLEKLEQAGRAHVTFNLARDLGNHPLNITPRPSSFEARYVATVRDVGAKARFDGRVRKRVAHGTNESVIVEPGVGELTTPIQPDLVRHQLGELKTVTPAERQVRAEGNMACAHLPYGVMEHTVWRDV